MMSEHPELPDLIRKTGVPVPQVLDRSGETLAWKPAEDMAPKLNDLLAALGAPEDAKQTDPAQAASMLALLKGLIDVISKRATETTLAQVLTKLSGDPATATKQDSVKAVLDAISTAVAARATEQTLGEIKTALTDGTQKVALTGSLVETDKLRNVPQAKTTIETIMNAQSIAAGQNMWTSSVPGLGASQVWVLVNIDKQPWTLWMSPGPHYPSGAYTQRTYPARVDVTTAYGDSSNPAVSLVLPFHMSSLLGLSAPANLTEALLLAGPISDNTAVAVRNGSAETATVTIKLVRVWR